MKKVFSIFPVLIFIMFPLALVHASVCYFPEEPTISDPACLNKQIHSDDDICYSIVQQFNVEMNRYNVLSTKYISCMAEYGQKQEDANCQTDLDSRGGHGKSLYVKNQIFTGCEITCDDGYYRTSSGGCHATIKTQERVVSSTSAESVKQSLATTTETVIESQVVNNQSKFKVSPKPSPKNSSTTVTDIERVIPNQVATSTESPAQTSKQPTKTWWNRVSDFAKHLNPFSWF